MGLASGVEPDLMTVPLGELDRYARWSCLCSIVAGIAAGKPTIATLGASVVAAGVGWWTAVLIRGFRQQVMPPQIQILAFSMAGTLTVLGHESPVGWTSDLTLTTVLVLLHCGVFRVLRPVPRRRDADPSDRGPLWDAEIDRT
jgi:hypothetical protein